MASYRIVEEDDSSGGGCIAAIIIGIIALAIILIIAYFALIVIGIILGIILLISAIIGTFFTIRNYVFALRDNVPLFSTIDKPAGWIIPNFVYKWLVTAWETFKDAWKYNWDSTKTFFKKSAAARFLSPKKWVFLFSSISVLLFGTLISVLILLFHVFLFVAVIQIILAVLFLALMIFVLVGSVIAAIESTKNYIARLKESYSSCSMTFSEYITVSGYKEYVSVIKEYFSESIYYVKDGFIIFSTLPLLSFKKWFRLGSSIMTVVVGSLLFVLYALIHIIVISVLFVVFKVISLFRKK